MENLDFDRISTLVRQLDEVVPQDGAAVVHDLDAIISAGCDNLIGDDEWLHRYSPGMANRRGMLRFGIEHLLAATASKDIGGKNLVEVNTSYLTELCMEFGYVVDEDLDHSKYIGVAEPGGSKILDLFLGAIALLVIAAAIVGSFRIVEWIGGLF